MSGIGFELTRYGSRRIRLLRRGVSVGRRGAGGILTRLPGGAALPVKIFPGCPDVSLDKKAICFAITSIL